MSNSLIKFHLSESYLVVRVISPFYLYFTVFFLTCLFCLPRQMSYEILKAISERDLLEAWPLQEVLRAGMLSNLRKTAV